MVGMPALFDGIDFRGVTPRRTLFESDLTQPRGTV
jgi:hypothetical protein